METIDPQAAAAAALESAPAEEPKPGEGGAAEEHEPEADAESIRLQLFAIVDSLDVVLRVALGPAMGASREEKLAVADAWVPYAVSVGGLGMPLWVPGLLVTASVYGPKVRARKGAPKEPPRDVDIEQAT